MVLRRDIERTLRLLHTHIDKLQSWGFVAGVLYSTRQGVIKTYGSPAITGVMRAHMEEVHDAITTGSVDDEGPQTTNAEEGDPKDTSSRELLNDSVDATTTFLPILETKLEDNSFLDNRSLASLCVKLSANVTGSRVGWGYPRNKPEWWPEHIPWTKRGLQMGVNNENLKEIITACYNYFGQPLYNDEQSLNNSGHADPVHENPVDHVDYNEAAEQHEEEMADCLEVPNTSDNELFHLASNNSLFLPILNTPVDKNIFTENRRIAVNCVKISMGVIGQRVGWGHPYCKPPWWPPHVPWTKRGVQLGVTNDNLKDVITACYEYHNQPMYSDNGHHWDPDSYVWLPEGASEDTQQEDTSSHSNAAEWTYDAGVETQTDQVPECAFIKIEPMDDYPADDMPYETIGEIKEELPEDFDLKDFNSNNMPYQPLLPILTKKLDESLFTENRTVAQVCVKLSLGTNRRRIGWGHPDSKPIWWPDHVPWTKRGVQMGVTNDHLKDVIRTCYHYYGQPLYAKEEDCQDDTFSSMEVPRLESGEDISGGSDWSVPNCFAAFSKTRETEKKLSRVSSGGSLSNKEINWTDTGDSPECQVSTVSRRRLHKNQTMPKKYSPENSTF